MPKEDLNITLIQSSLHWENKQANLLMFEDKIASINNKTDVIVLPEMFTTGFSMNAKQLAETISDSTTIRWLKKQATLTNSVITGSFIIEDNQKYFNRLIWMSPDGQYDCYDKRHLFFFAGEHQNFSAGNKKIICEVKGWKIFPLICYDLRFPVWSRNINLKFDCILFVANWPSVRIDAWDTLLKARALENLSYTIGVNRVGIDNNDIEYNGHSSLYSPKGKRLYFKEGKEDIKSLNLSYKNLNSFREKFPAYLDADNFTIKTKYLPLN